MPDPVDHGAARPKVGPSVEGARTAPSRLGCPGGEASSRGLSRLHLEHRRSDSRRISRIHDVSNFACFTRPRRDCTVPVVAGRTRSLRNALNRRQRVLAGAPPPRRSFAGHPLEHGREVRLRAEADGQRDFGQRRFGARQQRFCVLDALMQEIFARTVSRRRAELRCKVHAGQAGDLGEI